MTPSLDDCLASIYEPGFIPADSGVSPTVPVFPIAIVGNAFGRGAMEGAGNVIGAAVEAVGSGIGTGTASALSIAVIASVGSASGTGAIAGNGAEVLAPPLDGLGATSAFSLTRDLLTSFIGGTRYTTVSSAIDLVTDQTGNSRNLVQNVNTAFRPVVAAAGTNSRDAISFDGSNDYLQMTGISVSNLITASAGYVICSCVIDAASTNDTTNAHNNDGLFHDSGNFFGVFALNNAGAHSVRGYNWDGSSDGPTAHSITVGNAIVVEWKHTGGNVMTRVNGGSWNSTASGNTTTLTGILTVGAKISGTAQYLDCRVVELATFSSVLTTPQENALTANFQTWIGV